MVSEELFGLLISDEIVTVGAKSVLEIPFSFRPLEMAQACAHVIVEVHQEESPIDGIKWQFPIKGRHTIQTI